MTSNQLFSHSSSAPSKASKQLFWRNRAGIAADGLVSRRRAELRARASVPHALAHVPRTDTSGALRGTPGFPIFTQPEQESPGRSRRNGEVSTAAHRP